MDGWNGSLVLDGRALSGIHLLLTLVGFSRAFRAGHTAKKCGLVCELLLIRDIKCIVFYLIFLYLVLPERKPNYKFRTTDRELQSVTEDYINTRPCALQFPIPDFFKVLIHF